MGRITAEVLALLQERQGRTCTRRSSTPTGGTCSSESQWGTRCCSTRSTYRFRRGRCFPSVGLAPSRYSLAPRLIACLRRIQRRASAALPPPVHRGGGRRAPAHGTGAAQVQASLRQALPSRALGGQRRIGRHVGATRQLNGMCGGHLRLQAGHRPRAATTRAEAAGRRRRTVYAADVGAVRHGGLAARRQCSTRRPTTPDACFCPGPGGRVRPGPPVSGYPALTFSLVGGS